MNMLQQIGPWGLLAYLLLQIPPIVMVAIDRARRRRGDTPLLAATWSFMDLWFILNIALWLIIGLTFLWALLFSATVHVTAPRGAMPAQVLSFTADMTSPMFFWSVLAPSLVFQNLVMIGLTVVYVQGRYRCTAEEVGFNLKWLMVLKGLLLAPVGMLLAGVVGVAQQKLLPVVLGKHLWDVLMEWQRSTNSAEQILQQLTQPAMIGALAFAAVIIAPLGEEFFFRGYLFELFKRRISTAVAVIATAVLFSIVHIAPLNILPIVALGVLLAVVRHRTGNLWSAVGLHAGFNGLSVMALIVAKHLGIDPP